MSDLGNQQFLRQGRHVHRPGSRVDGVGGEPAALGAEDRKERHAGFLLVLLPQAIGLIDRFVERRAVDFLLTVRNQNDREEGRLLDEPIERRQD